MWLGKSISMNFFLECLERKRFANVSQRYAHSLFHIWNKKIKREKRHKKIFSPRDLIIPIARIEQKKKTRDQSHYTKLCLAQNLIIHANIKRKERERKGRKERRNAWKKIKICSNRITVV